MLVVRSQTPYRLLSELAVLNVNTKRLAELQCAPNYPMSPFCPQPLLTSLLASVLISLAGLSVSAPTRPLRAKENNKLGKLPLAFEKNYGQVNLGQVIHFLHPVDIKIDVVQSLDPNDKSGPSGFNAEKLVSGFEPLRYSIHFENIETAMAPAQDVVVTDHLDPALLNFETFSFGPVSVGNRRFLPPVFVKEFVTDLDLRPGNNIVVRISGKLESATGNLTWKFVSLDPATGLPAMTWLISATFWYASVHVVFRAIG